MAVFPKPLVKLDRIAHRACEYLLKFESVNIHQKGQPQPRTATVYIRVSEEISYPEDWNSRAMLSQIVNRRVVLKSAYYKYG